MPMWHTVRFERTTHRDFVVSAEASLRRQWNSFVMSFDPRSIGVLQAHLAHIGRGERASHIRIPQGRRCP